MVLHLDYIHMQVILNLAIFIWWSNNLVSTYLIHIAICYSISSINLQLQSSISLALATFYISKINLQA